MQSHDPEIYQQEQSQSYPLLKKKGGKVSEFTTTLFFIMKKVTVDGMMIPANGCMLFALQNRLNIV
jgi:hypothetical protein